MRTVSLELAKQLKESGYPQKGHAYFWTNYNQKDDLFYLINKNYDETWELAQHFEDALYAAPLADEILDQLPWYINEIEMGNVFAGELMMFKSPHKYRLGYGTMKRFIKPWYEDESLADAAAKMYLYLKKENLL